MDHSVFTKNRDPLLNTEIARMFFGSVRAQAKKAKLLSDEHFTVDGTLVKTWASMKSFRPKDDPGSSSSGDRNPEVDFRGEKRKVEGIFTFAFAVYNLVRMRNIALVTAT